MKFCVKVHRFSVSITFSCKLQSLSFALLSGLHIYSSKSESFALMPVLRLVVSRSPEASHQCPCYIQSSNSESFASVSV